jgi:hypothetical protein
MEWWRAGARLRAVRQKPASSLDRIGIDPGVGGKRHQQCLVAADIIENAEEKAGVGRRLAQVGGIESRQVEKSAQPLGHLGDERERSNR